MISLVVVFYLFVAFFAVVGGLRGWAKEMLVVFSVILTLFMIWLFENFLGSIVTPFIQLDRALNILPPEVGDAAIYVFPPEQVVPFSALPPEFQTTFRAQFIIRAVILGFVVFFGYQTPAVLAKFQVSARREKFQDFLLGLVIGAVNGYLVIGTLWAYMHQAHYPFEPYIIAPNAADPLLERARMLINSFAPFWLSKVPNIFIAIVLSLLFILVVFL
ncbi:MAG: hypothetical protein D6803_05675 [Anaerolineae bacterium]|nr:MAG: hypothetical protein D6803_05675 [Anaerolineae bacterium]